MAKQKTRLKPIDTPVYNYWKALYMSFYSRRLYVDVGKRWTGFGVLYLLLAVVLFSIPFSFRMSSNLERAFKEQITDPLLKVPVFYIQNGVVQFDKPMPYLINNEKNQTVIIIDTTGQVNDFTDKYPYLSILINKNQIAFKIPTSQLLTMDNEVTSRTGTPLVQPFDNTTNLVFDGKKIVEQNSVTGLKYASQLMIYPIIAGMFFSIFVVFFLVIALLGQSFATIFFSFKIPFATSSRLLMVAGTPMLLLLILMLTFNAVFQGLGVILFALLTAYYGFAIYALRAESKRIVVS